MCMSQLVQESFGMSQEALNDPNVAVKVKQKIELLRPPEFTYLSKYQKLNKWQQERLQEQQEHKLNTYHFEYKLAKAQEDRFCEKEERRIQRKLSVLEITDKETKVKMQYEVNKEPQIHCLFIGNKNPQKPAGYYKTKRTMIRFKEWVPQNSTGATGRKQAVRVQGVPVLSSGRREGTCGDLGGLRLNGGT